MIEWLSGISSILTIGTGLKDLYETASVVIKGDPQQQLLEQIAAHTQSMAQQVEKLGEHIYYAPTLEAVRDTTQSRQRRIEDLREVRASLEPVQQATGSDILSSALILTPDKMRNALAQNPFEVLIDPRPAKYFSARIPPEGVPVLFEHDGMQFLGWQTRGMLPILFNCEYYELTAPETATPAAFAAPPPSNLTARQDLTGFNADLQTLSFKTPFVNAFGEIIREHSGQAQYFTEKLRGGVGIDMVYIPPGRFQMGGTPEELEEILRLCKQYGWDENGNRNWFNNSLPRHPVTIQEGFFLSRTAITQAQYEIVMGGNPANFKGPNRPVETVSWEDATAFCERLSKAVKKDYRLPSEAEWEYACRAGTDTPFHYGETITDNLVNFNAEYPYASALKGQYRKQTTDVGSFPPNPFGLYDMHGNVWEWCADPWHDNYQGAPADGSIWAKNGNNGRRLLRGGGWNDGPRNCRAADRYWFTQDVRYYVIGFRVALPCRT